MYILNAVPLKTDIYHIYVFENAVGLIQQYCFLLCIKQAEDKTKTKCLEQGLAPAFPLTRGVSQHSAQESHFLSLD